MNDKKFYIIILIIIFLGLITSGILIKYTMDLKENVSITSFISTEEE